MGILQEKCRTTGKKALAYRGKGGQNTDIAFLALRLGVVLHLLTLCFIAESKTNCCSSFFFSDFELRFRPKRVFLESPFLLLP